MSGYRARHQNQTRRNRIVVLAALLISAVALAVPAASGGFFARLTNNTNGAATNPYFTCTGAVQGTPKAYFAYAFGESAGTTASDVSGNSRPGVYNPSGVTYGQANTGSSATCPRDKQTTIRLDGSSGYASGPATPIDGPNVFSVEIWFKTSAAQGKIIGFGDTRTGSSPNNDRHLYVDSTGKLVFGVYPGAVRVLSSSTAVTDNAWHQAVGTLSGAGMALYVDGKLVASDPNTTSGQAYSGYWRIGWDRMDGWYNTPSSYYFNGSLAFAAAYTDALTATQVAQHYAAGR